MKQALESLRNLHLSDILLNKVYVWAKKVHRSYLLWHWRMMQNLKKNWLVVWKMTGAIWQIFTRVLKSLTIETLMGSFYPKQKIYEIKIYREVTCLDNEVRCKIWRRIDMWFQNWIEEFDEFWPERSKVSKKLRFNGLLLTKVYNVWAKKSTEELCLMALKSDAKLEGKLTCAFKNDKNLANFRRLKNSDFILESKMAEPNQNKNINQEIDQM